jgi:hypothetical protein
VELIHRWRARQNLVWVVAAIASLVVTACSSSPTKKPSPHQSPTARATSSLSVVTGDAGDPTLLPLPSPVPVEQATSALLNEWQPLIQAGSLTLIPDTSVPYERPSVPPLTDGTGGAVDQTSEQRWADAFMREQAWENWAIGHTQVDFVTSGVISAPAAETGLYVPDGATALRIKGTRWPSAVRVVKVPQPAASSPPLSTSDAYAVLATYQQGWSVVAVFPDGHTTELTQQVDSPGETDYFIGHLDTSKHQLGEMWFSSVAGNCGGQVPPVVAQMCSQ